MDIKNLNKIINLVQLHNNSKMTQYGLFVQVQVVKYSYVKLYNTSLQGHGRRIRSFFQ